MSLDTPVAEPNQLLAVLVPVPARHPLGFRHPFGLLTGEPARQSVRRTVGQPAEVAFSGEPFQPRLGVGDANGVQPFGGSMFVVRGKVIGNRRPLVIGGRSFRRGDDFAFDQFGPAFQFAENRGSNQRGQAGMALSSGVERGR